MTQSDIIKIVLATPLAIAASIAIMFLSYLLVPLMIVTIVGSFVYAIYKASDLDKNGKL